MKKKNIALRTAFGLLIAVMLTTCTISGTFAKYVTTGNGSETARVAKWGVEVTITGDTFSTTYDDADNATVSASTAVVAPGTEGDFNVSFTIAGTPEVSCKVTVEVESVELKNWTVDGNYYCPLTIAAINGMNYTTADAFAGAVKAALNEAKFETTYGVGETFATSCTFGDAAWSWAFEGGTGDKYNQTDAKDTALGNATTAPTITVTYKITIEQVD